MKEQIKRF